MRAGGLAAAVVWAAVAVPAAPAAADSTPVAADNCLQVDSARDTATVEGANPVQAALHVPEAQALVRAQAPVPGAGVTVVVVDSGIGDLAEARPVATGTKSGGLASGHGRAVAGVIAGPDQASPEVPVGFAPGAVLVDAPFYEAPWGEGTDGATRPMAGALTKALQAVRARVDRRTIVVVPTEVAPDPALLRAVEALVARGALVIAAAGDRPSEQVGSPLDDHAGEGARPGEDVAGRVWPAAYDGVVAVGMSAPEGRARALRSSDVDVAAPGVGSVSLARDGGWCALTEPSTHWAAAEVAGVAALVWSAYPKESAATIRARLESTASGNGRASSLVTGHGVVQPVEALQRRSAAHPPAMEEAEHVERASLPGQEADVLAEARRDAVWWGVLGGGALLVLLVLRPVLARRRG